MILARLEKWLATWLIDIPLELEFNYQHYLDGEHFVEFGFLLHVSVEEKEIVVTNASFDLCVKSDIGWF